eukprot:5643823-Alexandrium_andersonii.AAC.1
MSASLVGSEMCIRDSMTEVLFEERGHVSNCDSPHREPPRLVEDWPTARPVSYTHLTLPTICSV